MKNNLLILIALIIFICIVWYISKSREGFQTSPVTSVLTSPDQVTPETCVIMNNTFETLKAKYIKAQSENNKYLVDILAESVKTVEKSMNDMGCSAK